LTYLDDAKLNEQFSGMNSEEIDTLSLYTSVSCFKDVLQHIQDNQRSAC